TGDAEWVVPGRLSGHGASVELTLQVQTTSMSTGQIALRALTELDRRALGVTAPRILIATRIAVHIDATFTAPAPR
ncbi:MAG TPA: YceI family protein, partial [Jatrophihabitans sp.]|nr:YceI family protein [Jatrophihabitans sp.]